VVFNATFSNILATCISFYWWRKHLQLPVQSVPITTKVMSSNPIHGKVYSIQHYVTKFVSDLRQVGGFLQVLWFSSTNKTDCQDITEILLKVALSIIHQPNLIVYLPVYH
jgi:hypothetical protein